MSDPQITLMPMTQLPSGVVIRADKILFIAREEIGKYVAWIENSSRAPFLTVDDIDFLRGMGAIQGAIPEATPAEPKLIAG